MEYQDMLASTIRCRGLLTETDPMEPGLPTKSLYEKGADYAMPSRAAKRTQGRWDGVDAR
jgi:hypothetical protein